VFPFRLRVGPFEIITVGIKNKLYTQIRDNHKSLIHLITQVRLYLRLHWKHNKQEKNYK
jgi:hypothetical protein